MQASSSHALKQAANDILSDPRPTTHPMVMLILEHAFTEALRETAGEALLSLATVRDYLRETCTNREHLELLFAEINEVASALGACNGAWANLAVNPGPDGLRKRHPGHIINKRRKEILAAMSHGPDGIIRVGGVYRIRVNNVISRGSWIDVLAVGRTYERILQGLSQFTADGNIILNKEGK